MGKQFPDRRAAGRVKAPILRGTFFAFLRQGHTLVELAVALAVVAILAGIGWTTFQDRITTYRMFRIARMLSADLTTARALALDTNREVRIHFVEADTALDPADAQHGAWDVQVGNRNSGSTQWDTLPVDVGGVSNEEDGERSLEPGGNEAAQGISLAQWTLADDAIVFTPRGWLANDASDFVDGQITLEIVNKRALGAGNDQRVRIQVARSGFVRMEPVNQ